MTNYYVSKAGNDTNDGLSWATAKKTVQAGADLITAPGGILNIGPGVYLENVTFPNGHTGSGIKGHSEAIIDGNGGTHCLNFTADNPSSNNLIQNVKFRNADKSITIGNNSTGHDYDLTVENCVFFAAPFLANRGTVDFIDCLFNCGSVALSNTTIYPRTFTRCTIVNTPFTNTGGAFTNCLLTLDSGEYYPVGTEGDYNVFEAVSATQTIGGQSSLSAWQSASGQDAHSFVYLDPMIDPDNGLYHLPAQSPLLLGGEAGQRIGAYPLGTAFSPAWNAAAWNAPAGATGIELDASGYWILSTAGTGVYRSSVIDLGDFRTLQRIRPVFTSGPSGEVLDYDNADADGDLTMRVRHSNSSFVDADAFPSWREVSLHDDLDTVARYVQYEVTLRTDGVF